jgi:hypothetical protein
VYEIEDVLVADGLVVPALARRIELPVAAR